MAPTGVEYNSDAEPALDESSSLSSANVKINEEKTFIQLYETKTEINSKKKEVISGKTLAIISIVVVVLLAAIIFYTVFLHLATWEAKIERRIQELSFREKSAGVIKIERANKLKLKTSNVGGVHQKQRNHEASQSQYSIPLKQNHQSNDIEGNAPSKGQLQRSNIYQGTSNEIKIISQSPHAITVDNSIPLLKLQQSQQKSSTLFIASNSINNYGKGVVSISSIQNDGVSLHSSVENNQQNSFVSTPTHNEPSTTNGKIIYSNDNRENSVNSEFQNNHPAPYQITAQAFQLNQQSFSSNNPAAIPSVQNFNPIIAPTSPQNSQNFNPIASHPQNSRVVVLAPIAPQQNIQNDVIQPTILPFNPQVRASGTTDYYGYDAGISFDLVMKGRQRRKLLDFGINQINDISKEEVEYYENKYKVGQYNQLPICVVVPTYNNAPDGRYLRNINSIIMQNYSNYHIVIIDDASTDLTGQLIKNHLTLLKYDTSKYTITTNAVKLNAMPNLRSAAMNSCGQQQIFLVVDGDDELLGRQVFKLFNAVFQQKGLWFVYSNFLMGAGDIGFSRPFTHQTIRSNSYRSTAFVTSHLRAFYTKLFRNIADVDLRDSSGQYFRAANDVAICIPSLEQSHLRVGYLPELAYFYNANTGNNNHFLRLQEQKSNDISLRSRPSYKPLEKLF